MGGGNVGRGTFQGGGVTSTGAQGAASYSGVSRAGPPSLPPPPPLFCPPYG